MNYDRLYHFFQKNILSDLELTLEDDIEKIIIGVHKVILMAHSAYFEKLLTFDKNISSKFTLRVNSVSIYSDVIRSFYKPRLQPTNPDWSYELSLIKCQDYLGVEINMPKIPLGIICSKDYDKILEICEVMGFDEDSLSILCNNLPKDYDLTKLSKELVTRLIDNSFIHIVTAYERNCIKLWNIITGELVHTLEHNEIISEVYFAKDRKFFALRTTRECYIYTAIGKLIYKEYAVTAIDFSNDHIHFAIAYIDYTIKLFDLIQKTITKQFDQRLPHVDHIEYIKFSFNGEYLASGGFDKCLKIWDVKNAHLLYNIDTTFGVKTINFSKDSSIITIENNQYKQRAWKIEKESQITTEIEILSASFHSNRYREMSDDIYLIVQENNGINVIDAKTDSVINFFDETTDTNTILSPDNKYIAIYRERSLDLCDVITGEILWSGQKGLVRFSSDNRYVAVKFLGKIRIFNLDKRIEHAQMELNYAITTIGFAEKNGLLIYGHDGHVDIYDIEQRIVINTLKVNLLYCDSLKIYNENTLRLLEMIELEKN